tara:strand:- start:290 stop:445 length:156 start_codon:yes stop_codon:yes gene_type:complete
MYLFFYIDYLNGPGMKDYSAEVGFDKKDGIFLDDIKTSDGNSWYDYFAEQL